MHIILASMEQNVLWLSTYIPFLGPIALLIVPRASSCSINVVVFISYNLSGNKEYPIKNIEIQGNNLMFKVRI